MAAPLTIPEKVRVLEETLEAGSTVTHLWSRGSQDFFVEKTPDSRARIVSVGPRGGSYHILLLDGPMRLRLAQVLL